MKVDSADRQQRAQEKIVVQPQNRKNHFSKLLNERLSDHHSRVNPISGIVQKRNDSTVENPDLVHLGTITDRIPTVSNLLIRHPTYRKDTWNIIQSEQNKDKPYTKIRPGTDIYLDTETLAISWNRDEFRSTTARNNDLTVSQENSDSLEAAIGESGKTAELIDLGTISQNRPTVSRILRQNADYRQSAYRIIHSEINQEKPYTRMVEGTRVYLNPETLEIVWDSEKINQDIPVIAQNKKQPLLEVQQAIPPGPDTFSENLVKSVTHFVGSSYEEIDCFELLVRGLDKMGVNYNGRGGLYDQLVKMAVNRGLPKNAYLNGEGLIEASGTQVYYKSMPSVQNPEAQADKIYMEMEPLLNKGLVLSFSTQTRGHTGVVSQKDQLWTYINSGAMDHNVGGKRDPKGVGEEVLAEEIKNWVKIAARSKQHLKITLGRLDAQKLLGVET
jgi:hypothetical protein